MSVSTSAGSVAQSWKRTSASSRTPFRATAGKTPRVSVPRRLPKPTACSLTVTIEREGIGGGGSGGGGSPGFGGIITGRYPFKKTNIELIACSTGVLELMIVNQIFSAYYRLAVESFCICAD